MSDTMVSIIVPVYNVEKFIEKCVNSLQKQDYTNIEIILVDDGSPDSSAAIIDRLAAEDKRVKAIHQKNQGVSTARNTGIQAASGEYLMFVDGDDWVDTDYVSYFLNLVTELKCDIGMDTNNYSLASTKSSDVKYKISAEKTMEWIYLGQVFVAVWNKIYKTSLLRDNCISFNKDIWYGEGMLFNIECLQYVDSVAIGEKAVYHQMFNAESAMRKFNLNSNYCGLRSMYLQKEAWKKKNDNIEKAWEYHTYCFNRSIIDGLVRSDMVSSNKSVYDKCVHDLRKNICIPLKIEKRLKKRIGWLLYYVSPMFMAKRAARKFLELKSQNNL